MEIIYHTTQYYHVIDSIIIIYNAHVIGLQCISVYYKLIIATGLFIRLHNVYILYIGFSYLHAHLVPRSKSFADTRVYSSSRCIGCAMTRDTPWYRMSACIFTDDFEISDFPDVATCDKYY